MLVVGQGEHDEVSFLKSSSSSPFLADHGESESSHFSTLLLDVLLVLDGSFWERLVVVCGRCPAFLSFGVVSVMLHGRVRVQGARG
jgi:hypothetical protein